ncbi:MAG: flagellar filament capping protein FliD [Gemmobacter sp.]|nr:flagellar filament capping protein FliD [Gemmobacter sp.]
MALTDILSALNKSGSGINLNQLASSLAEASAAAPKAAAEKQASRSSVAVSALGSLRAQLAGLAETARAIAAQDLLSIASSSSAVQARVTDRPMVASAASTVEVLQLAKSQVLEFSGFSARNQTVGPGTITVEVGVWYTPENGGEAFASKPGTTGVTIEIAEGTTIEDLAKRLSALPGVSAALVDKGDGTFSLGILSESGAGNALRLTTTGAGLAAFDTTARNADVQVQAARNAMLTVNGVLIQRETNQIENAIPGLSLSVSAVTGPVTIAAGRNAGVALANLNALVGQMNAARDMLSSLTARGVTEASGGALAGDPALRQIAQDLDALLRAPLPGYGPKAPSAVDFGIRSLQTGALFVDQAAFRKAFSTSPEMFDALFSDRLQGDGVEIGGVVPPTFLPGSYSFRRDAQTGQATLDGRQLVGLDLGDGRHTYISRNGPATGLILTVANDVTDARIDHGQSLVSRLDALVSRAVKAGGALSAASDRYEKVATTAQAELLRIGERAKTLQDLYVKRFAAMEQAVSRFNSTSAYLDSLVTQWNKDD